MCPGSLRPSIKQEASPALVSGFRRKKAEQEELGSPPESLSLCPRMHGAVEDQEKGVECWGDTGEGEGRELTEAESTSPEANEEELHRKSWNLRQLCNADRPRPEILGRCPHDRFCPERIKPKSARESEESSPRKIGRGSSIGGLLLFPDEGSKSYPYDHTHRH